MKIDVKVKELDIVPSTDILDYDLDTVPWKQMDMGSIHHMAKVHAVLRTKFDLTGETTRADENEYPINALVYEEIRKLEEHYNATAKIAILLRLEPGGYNKLHRDISLIFQKCHRCHLPLRTDPSVKLESDGELIHLKKGVWVEIDNTTMHRAMNDSSDYRVHLVVDLLPNV